MPCASASWGARASALSQAASASPGRSWARSASARLACAAAALRIEPDGGGMGTGGVGQAAPLPEEIAEIGVRARMPWSERDRPLGRSDGLVETAELAQDDAQIRQRVGMVRPCRQGPPDQVRRRRVVAEPVLDEPEMMQGRGMLRVHRQNAAQRRGGLGKPAMAQVIGGGAKLARQSRIADAGRCRSLALVRGPPLLPVHRSWPQHIGCGA